MATDGQNLVLDNSLVNEALWDVSIPVPLRKNFVYRIPAGAPAVRAGMRVLVPFGHRRLTGYLLQPSADGAQGPYKIKPILSVLDDKPAIPDELLQFLRRSADYYMHPLGEVLRAALPPGIDPVERKGALKGPRIKEKKETIVTSTDVTDEELQKMTNRAPKRAAVLQRIIAATPVSVATLRKDAPDASKHVKRLHGDGLIQLEEKVVTADPFGATTIERDVSPELNEEQTVAVNAIYSQLDKEAYRGFLLHGITGSGKTEVYLHAVEKARALGKGALVLVPEITLTPQLVGRYRARFGDQLAVWHSALSDRERYDQWRALRDGTVSVAIGVRSAVFAPVQNLGLIVVDEEHDGSFKQERGFPYHARDLALLRASRLNAVTILGSATPSLESFHNAHTGKLALLPLKERATSGKLPAVDLINLSAHRNGPAGQSVISGPLFKEIQQTLARKEQIILFLNRRGFAPNHICQSCGDVIRCEDCSVSMTLHRHPPTLTCHYCGAHRPIPGQCGKCGGSDLSPVGTGTQKVEEMIQSLFPEARVARLDRDVTNKKSAEEVLDRLRNHEVDILVGTQMITKGHDFPKVTLVGVLQSDVGLHMPDFRSSERTFQLLTQVAGRAGRADLEGLALIQTYSPEHHALQCARQHDFHTFAQQELESREELGYPPFGKLTAIRLNSRDAGKVEDAARTIIAQLRDAWHQTGQPPVMILGPAPAPLEYLQNRHRWQIFLKAPTQDAIRLLVKQILPTLESPPGDVRIKLDINPVSML